MQHLFEFKLREVPRTMTRQEWKEAQRFLRECRIQVEKHLDEVAKLAMDYIAGSISKTSE